MKAIKIIQSGSKQAAELQDVPLPTLRDDYVLCKVTCVALNPTDWKHIDGDGGIPGSGVGSDMRGVIEEVGTNVSNDWKKGDRIAAFVHGGNDTHPEDGTETYTLGFEGISDEDAASLGVGVTTCGQALYQSLRLPLPGSCEHHGKPLLVYGGSTGTGMLAIQYAKLSGYTVIATASSRNWPLLKFLGADEVFDYKDPDCASKIRSWTNDKCTLALDCISEGSSPNICEEALSSQGGTITYLLKSAMESNTRTDIELKHTSGYTAFGEAFDKLGAHVPAKEGDLEHARMFWRLTQRLLQEGRLKPAPVRVGGEGLVGVFGGMQEMRDGRLSGEKLVYRVGETPT
ncbi:uncharacterized protein LTR77_010721 [Saxophila tyrrhenica]|uniref:Enoyl reductase (ER) domain-containing protein n=1 Tax=Saxophila tyrrhenica TaxID=1690608 RepID=A0AAV9NWA1_9PEZI|nr:hypothetical protein LTR77_010721 [Saxophila tyrrhenica]